MRVHNLVGQLEFLKGSCSAGMKDICEVELSAYRKGLIKNKRRNIIIVFEESIT